MSPVDWGLLERWLTLIARLRERGAITSDTAAELRRQALEAVT